ncbi:amidohydrolase family protein [Bradyrhizobium pachyrhizi]|uniref:amidohydrolase family protein n=1 Tax=Bradyrhizobium pachyrhizi TaxID=280333 RepID=UPI0024B25811|nr:amidohydrolase family protein [Bradyrhizobium pachyrhizi]WFU53125.1 amidohydrolase family protein [Bradyrhizobium pachyrhizi]
MIGTWLRVTLFLIGSAIASVTAQAETIVLRGGTLYASADAEALPDAVIVMTDGVISAVGKSGDIQAPPDARVIDCSGKTIVAGFWNSHVHFTQKVWRNAGAAPPAALTQHMQEMLTRWGFTTVWDLGSDPSDTLPLRKRIAAGEVAGPNILLAGNIFPKGGHPVYIPREVQLPEVATPEEATKWARDWLAMGEDGIKLFTGAFMGDKPVVNMDPAIAKAAVDVAHAQGRPVFAHPQNKVGVETVIESGVDVLAHTTPGEPSYTADQLARFKANGTALVPTLSLFTTVVLDPNVTNRLVASTVNQLKQFSENGGTVLFGTDVGFTTLYDTTQEFQMMHRVLSERQVLASLTTNPARFFKAAKKGRVEQGFDADLVVLDGDPLGDVGNLAKVSSTIRAGHVIYQKP